MGEQMNINGIVDKIKRIYVEEAFQRSLDVLEWWSVQNQVNVEYRKVWK